MTVGADVSANDILWVARVCVNGVERSGSAKRGEVRRIRYQVGTCTSPPTPPKGSGSNRCNQVIGEASLIMENVIRVVCTLSALT